ncbi:hypothetical protein E2C01_025592 [Portunus trituberculatus]|uniref:Uncharacterized protein n=1 Tax=Portunus trituberculatus TaxID=210409 RepID=A0A5B7EGV4_PORTR|nr:hypothetical protein [Portunus trituberculatus]
MIGVDLLPAEPHVCDLRTATAHLQARVNMPPPLPSSYLRRPPLATLGLLLTKGALGPHTLQPSSRDAAAPHWCPVATQRVDGTSSA